jgi:hypothetical protein
MTVSSTVNREQYATNGVTTAFTIHFPFIIETDVNAIFVTSGGVSTTLALNTDFTVSGGLGSGGTLTMMSAPATGGTLTIYRDLDFTQETHYVEDDPLPADSLEGDIDRSVMRDQQLQDGQDRALTFPVTIGASVSAVLPNPSADAYLGWASDGLSLENKTLSAIGVLVKASNPQAVAGTDDAAYMTAATTKAALQGATYDTGQVSTDASATEGPTDEQFRDSASPAVADLLGVRSWAMRSSTAVKRVCAKILARVVDATNASEDIALDIYTIIAGTLARRFSFGAGLYANGLSDMGAGTVNATALYVNGAGVGGVKYSGSYATNADLSTVIPLDDTTPTSTEGTQVISVGSVVTTTTTQKVRGRFSALAGVTADLTPIAAIFRGTTCIQVGTGASLAGFGAAATLSSIAMDIDDAPAAAGTYTYSVRVGPSATTMRLNGTLSARRFGGTASAVLNLEVYEP